MRTRMVVFALAASVSLSACVTEGGPVNEPASDAEAAQANVNLGVGYLTQGRPDAAVDALERALDLDPRSVDAHSTLAVAYDLLENPELAEQHHRRATQLDANDGDAQYRYAVFLCRGNRWGEAERHLQRAIANPRETPVAELMTSAGTCARSANDLESAERYFRDALAMDPSNAAALEGMVDLSIRTENYLQGRAFIQRLFAATKPQAAHLLYCYVIEEQLGDSRAAGDCAVQLRTSYPDAPEVGRLAALESDGR